MRILAIDSGLERTGYALFDKGKQLKNGFNYLHSGLIHTDKSLTKENRLLKIYQSLSQIVKTDKPRRIVMEQLFFFKNAKTVISVAQAQGVVLLLASQHTIPLEFLTPLQIKQIITGYGRADKKSVQKMLKLTLPHNGELKQDDVADAIACGAAYCYLNQKLSYKSE
ncbi:crossover junction endodeoxyribonuclease RuvC [Candidatus Roizmanbacteria bacterium]|nr:crossover junction endodeoxyribonuclease RuvC [Candidatus Roizmanbacteria bacterium]